MKKNNIRYFLLLIFATCVLMGVQACGGDEPDSPNPEPTPTPPPTSATMSTVMTQLLDQTSCLNPDQTRLNLINEVQKFSDACSKADYDKYYKLTSASDGLHFARIILLPGQRAPDHRKSGIDSRQKP